MRRFLVNEVASRERPRLNPVILFIFLISHAFFSVASNAALKAPDAALSPSAELEQQRAVFIEAEKAIRARQYRRAEKLQQQLTDYPLLPYLEYLQLSRSIGNAKASDVRSFLSDHSDTHLADRLRNQWLRALAKRRKWTTYLEFSVPTKNVVLDCHRRTALLTKKRTQEAYENIKSLWMVGVSRDAACDPVFKAWQKSRAFKKAYYWERAVLALEARQFKLAAYLARQTHNKKYQARVTRWKRLYRDPKRLLRKRYSTDNDFDRKLVLMGLTRLLKTRGKSFPRGWARYGEQVSKPSDDLSNFSHFAARWYSWHYDERAWEWLERADPQLQDEELMARRIRMVLQARDWAGVLDWISKLPPAQQDDQAWRYWAARARLQTIEADLRAFYSAPNQSLGQPMQLGYFPWVSGGFGQGGHVEALSFHDQFMQRFYATDASALNALWGALPPQQTYFMARAELAALAEERHFYGFLASEFLGQAPKLNHRPFEMSDDQRQAFLADPGIKAAQEWYQLDRLIRARRAWSYAVSRLSPAKKSVAAKVAHEWGWYDQAIHTAASAAHKDDLLVRFPMGHFDVVSGQAKSQSISPDWVFALIRQESAYRAEARSPVGALGLMQLMPGTAKILHRKHGERYPGRRGVLRVNNNVKLGTRYMAQLADRFKGSLPLATAGYNAGPRRSVSWQDPTESIPGDLWIETVPIAETREYVKNIMTYQVIYRWHLGHTPVLDESVSSIPPLRQTEDRYSVRP